MATTTRTIQGGVERCLNGETGDVYFKNLSVIANGDVMLNAKTWAGGISLVQNIWKRGGDACPAIAEPIPVPLEDGMTLTFKANGAVAIGGTSVGDDGIGLVSLGGSAQVVSAPEGESGFRLTVYVAPKKNLASGLLRTFDVKFSVMEDNIVTDVKVTESK